MEPNPVNTSFAPMHLFRCVLPGTRENKSVRATLGEPIRGCCWVHMRGPAPFCRRNHQFATPLHPLLGRRLEVRRLAVARWGTWEAVQAEHRRRITRS